MIRLELRTRIPRGSALAAPVVGLIAALALAAIPIAIAGRPLLRSYELMAMGAFGSAAAIEQTMARAAPLIFAALAVCVALRVRLHNFGAEGQLLAGALAFVAAGSSLAAAPAWAMVPLMLVAAAGAGALLMLLAAALRIWRGTDEALVTLLLNVAMLPLMYMLLAGPLGDPGAAGTLQSKAIPALEAVLLPLRDIPLRPGLLLALLAALLVHAMLRHTLWGFDMRAVGGNAQAARLAGIPINRVLLRVALISGALAGLAGACTLAGPVRVMHAEFSSGLGYLAIAAAVLAGLSPLGSVAMAVLVAGLGTGLDAVFRKAGLPVTEAIVVVSMLLALIARTFVRYRLRWARPRKATA